MQPGVKPIIMGKTRVDVSWHAARLAQATVAAHERQSWRDAAMDGERFDALARVLTTKESRRGTLGAVLAAVLLGQNTDALAKPGKGKGKARRKHGNRHKNKNKRKNRKGRRSSGTVSQHPAPIVVPQTHCCGAGNCSLPQPGGIFEQCNYSGRSLAGGDHQGALFSGIDGRGADFDHSDNRGALFVDACLQGASFRGARLGGAVFSGACLVDADFAGADLGGEDDAFAGGLLCRTILPDGAISNRDCDAGGRCCQNCLAIGTPCDGNARPACCEGAECRDGTCVPRSETERCPVEVCQVATRDPRGNCVYTNSPNNQPGPACTSTGRFCCNGNCCRQGDVCLASGCCTPEPVSQTCQGRCDAVTNNCGQVIECGDCALRSCQIAGCNRTTCEYTNSPNGVPGARCPAPFFCCNGGCCQPGDVCTTTGCCTPDPPSCEGQCGDFTDSCGRQLHCGACADVTCQVATCDPRLHTCQYANSPNRTGCTTATGQAGICCSGTCVGGAQCCATSDCPQFDPCQPNLCQNNQCVLTREPDMTVCAVGGNPGRCCGGSCITFATCCATSDCPDRTCQAEKLCSDNICQYQNLPTGQQGPNCRGQGQFCCGGGVPEPASCCNAGQTCSGVTCSGA
jgi:uncharacterized protein YjbI with pentapeptide repeats